MASDYAMQAKARSLFAKHLTRDKYETLAHLKDVNGIANYLRNDTRYDDVLSSIQENDIHREILERKIRLLGQVEFVKLMRYVRVGSTNFYEYYIKRREIEQILFAMHSIESGVPFKIEYYIDKIDDLMEIDISRLSKIQNFKDLSSYLDTTSYKGVLHTSLQKDGFNIAMAEDSLNHHYRKFIEKLISKENNREEIQNLFDMDDELKTVEHIYRLKKNYNMQADRIIARLKYRPYLISLNVMKQWTKQYDADDFIEAFKKSSYHRYINTDNFHSIETYLNGIRYQIFKHHLKFATNTNLTLMSYLELVQFEIDNVIDIIEGVRYEMKPEEILELITI